MTGPALCSDVGGDFYWDVGMTVNCNSDISEYCDVPVNPDYKPQECSDDVDKVIKAYKAALLDEKYRWEPIGHYFTRKYDLFDAPPYFKRDHPDDDLFLKQLGDAQLPWTYPNHADEPLVKDVVALIIWQDTKDFDFWETLRNMSPPHQDDSLYSDFIRGAASLVSFFYTKANLFKIGHEPTLEKQMDKIYTQAEKWGKMRTPIDQVCNLLVQLTANNHEFSFVTENDLADMLSYYAVDIRYHNFKRPSTIIKVIRPPTEKDQLLDDITKVVRKAELSPAQLPVDEYTHWMMTLLREDVSQVEFQLISRAMGEHPMVRLARPSQNELFADLFGILLNLLGKAKDRIKRELVNVLQPLFELCNLHQYKMCTEISEIVQVADLRRMSLGSRFIGRSHLIWAFYKLGYALPLEVRNTINIYDSDKDLPPYHIYMVALKLALRSGKKMMQLDHFVYAILHSKDIDFDGEREIDLFQDFKDFQKALESMETEIEPKSTVTVRPCGSLDVFSDLRDDSHDTEERTINVEPKSSENSSTDTGGAEESII